MSGDTAPDLIAVLLVTASASGAHLVFRWPPKPRLPVRFSRPKPLPRGNVSGGIPAQMLIDAAYGCSHNISNKLAEELVSKLAERPETDIYADEKYLWHRSHFGKYSSSSGVTHGTNPCTGEASAVFVTRGGDNAIPSGVTSGSESGTGAPDANAQKSVPSQEKSKKKARGPSSHAIYDDLIGYDAAFLADLLSPIPTMCHQKFELVVDELAFIGHPVHAKVDGSWEFAELSGRPTSASFSASVVNSNAENDGGVVRGRVHDRPNAAAPRSYSTQPRQIFQIAADDGEEGDTEEIVPTRPRRPSLGYSKTVPRSVSAKSAYGQSTMSPTYRRIPSNRQFPAQLKSFHLVLVLDRPDPSSIASTDLDRYIDAYYTQFAFKLTAAMLYEQGSSNFIAQESHSLLALRDRYLSAKSTSPQSDREFTKFFERALRESTLASALRTAYEAVISSTICQVMINTIPVNIQLPPGHLDLLKVGTRNVQADVSHQYEQGWGELEQDDDEDEGAGEDHLEDELRFGWKVPPLRPWKTVVLLDHAIKPTDIAVAGRRITSGNPMMNPTEILPRFMAAASPTMTLYAIAQAMQVDLETELYALIRLLVYNRKAKVLDVVRMVNVYTLPSIFPRPLYELTDQFALEFPAFSPLPILLNALSVSHRTFASIVGPSTPTQGAKLSSEAYASSPQRSDFFRVLIWMLTHDLLVMLHARVRIYIPRDIKVAALATQRAEKGLRKAKRMAHRSRANANANSSDYKRGSIAGPSTSPVLRVNSASSIRAPSLHHASTSRPHSPTTSRLSQLAPSRPKSSPEGPHLRHKHAVSFDKVVSVGQPPIGSAPSSHGESSESTLNDENGEQEEDGSESLGVNMDNNGQVRDSGTSSSDGIHESGRRPKQSSDPETSELEEEEDIDLTPSFLNDPERATRGQRRWLDEICQGSDQAMVKGFRRIIPYLDGKTTTDEIMYRTGISRGQLREILRHFDPYLTLLLHP